MDATRLLLVTALFCASAFAAAEEGGGRTLHAINAVNLSAAAGDPGTVTVLLDGAVERPGAVKLPSSEAKLENVLAANGGATRDSYRLATLLLRRTGANNDNTACVPIAARHAALLIQDDAKLGKRADLVAQLLSGQLIRIDARDTVANEPGTQPVQLQDSDLLALPGRSGIVYVATAQGAVVRLRHEPSLAADHYVKQLSKADRKGVDQYTLHYPNGQQFELALDVWRYRPTMVPPGSLIAPDSVCMRSE